VSTREQVEAATERPLLTASLPAQIYKYLEDSIIDGELLPGTRLRADDIAARYQVSRIPVREALSALAEAGWVDMRPRYGVYVRARTREELTELFEARAGVEQEIARLAAARRTEADLDRMAEVVARSRDAVAAGDREGLSAAAVDYNIVLRQAGRNGVLAGLSLLLEKRARFYFSPVASLLAGEWLVGQERLLALLREGDVDGSGASARSHIEQTGRDVARLLGSEAFSA
jgi:DNA-binding GntR family transcriptional regulator